MKYSFQYLLWGLVSNAALWAYFRAPREMLQDEFFYIHRAAIKRAHNARVKGEHAAKRAN